MDNMQSQIGIREYTAIALALSVTKVSDDIPSLLFQRAENSAWMIPLFSGIIMIIPIYLLIKMVMDNEKNCFFEVIQDACGKVVGRGVIFFLWVLLTIMIIILSATYVDIITTMYFIKTPHIVIYGAFLFICGYGAMKGIQSIGSVIWLGVFPIALAWLLTIILSFSNGNMAFLFPILGPGIQEITSQSTIKVAIYIDFLFLAFLAAYVKKANHFKKGTWIVFIIVIVQLTIAITSYTVLFDYKPVQLLNYPYHEAIRFAHIGFLKNLELFFFPFWAISAFVRFAIYLYIHSLIFGRLFRIKQFKYIIPAFILIIICIGLTPQTPALSLFKYHTYALHASSVVVFFLPIILWILLLVRKKGKQNETTS